MSTVISDEARSKPPVLSRQESRAIQKADAQAKGLARMAAIRSVSEEHQALSVKATETQKPAETPIFPVRNLAAGGPVDARAQVEQVAPESLTLHQSLADFPPLSKSEMDVLRFDIATRKQVLVPLLVTLDNKIVDGLHRWIAAKELGLKSIPIVRIDDSLDKPEVALSTALARRQLTKSGIALFVFLKHPELQHDRADRRAAGLRKGSIDGQAALSFRQLEDRYQIPPKYLTQLSQMREEASEKDWAEICGGILRGESSIAALFQGWRGRRATKGQKRKTPKLFSLLIRSLGVEVQNRFKGWKQFSEAERKEAVTVFAESFKSFPAEFKREVAKCVPQFREGTKQ